ncbi:MAG: DUF4062 domain-containing protein [Acutalibacteraceae bacterium]|nr:DUF4062 domain-containing protein [Acutalibacteraceae bacterium]
MNKPIVFISSTIYDFSDLRSSMKYWLDEMGFNTQLSEYNDFIKDTTQNSYDACLQAVEQCDYFILMIGSRRGGMYPGEDISITRKEYRTAYQLAKEGRIKRIIVLVRQNIWEVREDRKALRQLLGQLKIYENDKKVDNEEVVNHNSNILTDAKHIMSFIDEVTRNREAKNLEKPVMNWIHTFLTFEDIVQVLKSELKIKVNMSVKIAEQNIKSTLIFNMQNITSYKDGNVVAFYLGFSGVREKLKQFREKNEFLDPSSKIYLTTQDVNISSNFLLLFRSGIKDMDTSIYENILSSGVFLSYCHEQGTFLQNNFSNALSKMIREIKRLKQLEIDLTYEMQERILRSIEGYHNYPDKKWEFSFFDLGMYNGIYERLVNIQRLTSYMLQYIDKNDDSLSYPELLEGFLPSSRPTEEEMLKIFER